MARSPAAGRRATPADGRAGNAGLAFEKYVPCPPIAKTDGAVIDWLEDWGAAGCGAKGGVGHRNELAAFTQRRKRLIETHLCGCVLRFRLRTPLLTGLGMPHPVHAGVAWHRSLGVPYVPASGVKGTVRAWVEAVTATADAEMAALIELAFGRAPVGRTPAAVGAAVLFDAVPMPATGDRGVRLLGEIVNNHHPGYYRSSLSSTPPPPADWYNPVPVANLAVAAGEFIDIGLALRRRPDDRALLTDVRDALIAAVNDTGLGARTAAGYGRLDHVG